MAKITYGVVLLIISAAQAGLTPPNSPGDIDAFNARSDSRSGKKELNDIDCHEMNTSCEGCINLEHCYFAIEKEGDTKCMDRTVEPNMELIKETIEDANLCPNDSSDATKIPPKFDPDVITDETKVPTGSTTASSTTVTTTPSQSSTGASSSTTTASTTTTSETTTQRCEFFIK